MFFIVALDILGSCFFSKIAIMNNIIAFSLSASSFSVAMICVIALVTNSWLVVQSSVTLISGEIGFITVPKGLWLDQGKILVTICIKNLRRN